jgi:mRNA interferase MazF
VSPARPVRPTQGEIWWAEAEDKRRPVLIVSRTDAALHLNRLIVAPITRTVRGIPTELALDESNGLGERCAASFDNLIPQPVSLLTQRIGHVPFARAAICSALAALADC